MAEVKKLVKPLVAMSNRELVELLIGCLTDQMALAVLQFLGNIVPSSKPKTKEKNVVSEEAASSLESGTVPCQVLRQLEDRYDLENVCRAAIQVSSNSQGMFLLINKPTQELTEECGVLMLN